MHCICNAKKCFSQPFPVRLSQINWEAAAEILVVIIIVAVVTQLKPQTYDKRTAAHLSNGDTELCLTSGAIEHFVTAYPAVSLTNSAFKRQPIGFLPQPTFISVQTSSIQQQYCYCSSQSPYNTLPTTSKLSSVV